MKQENRKMNELDKLVNTEVGALILKYDEELDTEVFEEIRCKVLSYSIDTYYFEEKNEPIYITFNLDLVESIKDFKEYDQLNDVSIDNIRR